LCVIIPIVIVVLSRILNSPLKNTQKNTTYECGFNQISDSRNIFDVQFFVTGVLFLLFDVEIIFLFPWALNFSIIGVWGVFVGLVFVYILIFGFMYE
jgi:NADH-quinone oxidoreductase subunit A